MSAVDRDFEIGDRALSMMELHSDVASPHCFEIWFAFVDGGNPPLGVAVGALMARHNTLSCQDVDRLYTTYISSASRLAGTECRDAGIAGEIDAVTGSIDRALGLAVCHGSSLASLADEPSGGNAAPRPHEVIDLLVVATREVIEANRLLETRIRQSRAEIDTLRRSLESMRIESMTDPLTGLANRRCFDMTLAAACERAAAEGTPLSLILLDIDHFKQFNDLYGHVTGDQVLRLVCATMRDRVREGATLARFGGEEFAIILPGWPLAAALRLAEDVRTETGRQDLLKCATGESLGQVTLSLGVVALAAGETDSVLIQRADLCLYAAKRMGRNRTMSEVDVPQSLVETPTARVA